jgi:hypothetical protein
MGSKQHISIFPMAAQIWTKSSTLVGVVGAKEEVSSLQIQDYLKEEELTRFTVKICNT